MIRHAEGRCRVRLSVRTDPGGAELRWQGPLLLHPPQRRHHPLGIFSPWYFSRAFGSVSSTNGIETSVGKILLAVVLIGALLPTLRPVNEPPSRYAWGMALVGVLTLLLAYEYTGRGPDDPFVVEHGAYVTMVGGAMRAALVG